MNTYIDKIRESAIENFGLDPVELSEYEDISEICDLIDERLRTPRVIAEEALEIRDPLISQPGSRWIVSETAARFLPVQTAEYVPPEFQELFNACAGDASVDEVRVLAMDLGFELIEVRFKSKEEICRMVIRYLELLRARY